MLTVLLLSLAHAAFAKSDRCSPDGVFRTRIILATAPWRDGTLIAEGCVVDHDHPATGDWQQLLFVRTNGSIAWTRPLGEQDPTGELWWSDLVITPKDVDGDNREEVILAGQLSNCGAGGCIVGTARLYLWPDLPDTGGDCARRGFEEDQRARLLVWENARFDAPGWPGPSWVRTSVGRSAFRELSLHELWTALPPGWHDPIEFDSTVIIGPGGIQPHCGGKDAPGV